jgi:CRP-like cAMP-binding protein
MQTADGVWRNIADALSRAPDASADGEGLWDRLAARVDPAEFRPKLREDVEIKEFHLRWGGDYAMVANPRDLLHYELKPNEVRWVKLMDGTRTTKEILVEGLQDSGDLELSGVADLVRSLHAGNFLEQGYLDVDGAVKRAIDPQRGPRERAKEFARSLTLDWKGADRPIRAAYDGGLRFLFTPLAQLFMAAIVLLGFVAFYEIVHSHRYQLAGDSLTLAFLVLLALNYALTVVHEMGHALVLVHYGRKVKSAGFMIYFGSPALYIESADGLMLEPRQRVLQSFAGGYGEMLFCGLAAIALWIFPNTSLGPTLYKFAVLGYLVMFLNFVPLLELDGYWMMTDLLQVKDLRPMSIAFVRHDLWHKLRRRQRLSKQEIGLAVYGILGILFTIYVLYVAFFFWREIFGGLVSKLWHGGVLTRVLLVALALFVTGPLIRGAINFVRALVRRGRALWARVRFKLETKWRVEAAELIDGLPLFEDVPAEALSDLAGRVRLRTFARNQPVVRQGDRADAFYVVRKGTLQVVETDSVTGNERALRVLGRGEGFGELGLAEASPRTATVRALEESQVFEVDKGTFGRLLADMIHVPQFGPSLQAVGELRELSCFSHLEPDELAALLEHGRWGTFAPGETVIEQGEVGDAFFAIRSGQVDVFVDGQAVRTQGPGSYFGEIALLLDVPRTATVTARTQVRAYRLEREGFDSLVRDAFRRGTLNPVISPDRVWQH